VITIVEARVGVTFHSAMQLSNYDAKGTHMSSLPLTMSETNRGEGRIMLVHA
jgi:hypothetical protein